MSKRELVKRLMTFFNRCLRMARGYNFDMTLVEAFECYFQHIFESGHALDKQTLNMRYFFASCAQKLRLKLRLDPKLQEKPGFGEAFARFEKLSKRVEIKANEIHARVRQERFLIAEENNRVRKQVQRLENSTTELRTFKRIINLVSNNFQIRFYKGHL
jgi:hypothetical protein